MKKPALIMIVLMFMVCAAIAAPRFIQTTRRANIRAGASTNSTLVATSQRGDIFQLINETDKWYVIRVFSGSDRYLYKTLAEPAAYEPSLPDTIETRREIFRAWGQADEEAKQEADRRYPPESNLERNLQYLQLQLDRKKLDISHKYDLQPPDLRRIVLEGNLKGW